MLIAGFCLFIVLNAVDCVVTNRILSASGREFNFIVRAVIERWGFVGLVILKVAILSIIAACIWFNTIDLYTMFCWNAVYLLTVVIMWIDARKNGIPIFPRLFK